MTAFRFAIMGAGGIAGKFCHVDDQSAVFRQ